ncbi:MAG: MauE/DoxX family redox-associated membrane protein, partial [Pseudomonadota bacterium]
MIGPVGRYRAGLLLGSLMAVFFFATAILKLLDLEAFAVTLSRWTIIPDHHAATLATLVPGAEVAAAAAWALFPNRRVALPVMLALMVVFTGAFAAEMAIATAPDCGCFGKIVAYESFMANGWGVIIRNGALISAIIIAFVLLPRPAAHERTSRENERVSVSRGF